MLDRNVFRHRCFSLFAHRGTQNHFKDFPVKAASETLSSHLGGPSGIGFDSPLENPARSWENSCLPWLGSIPALAVGLGAAPEE